MRCSSRVACQGLAAALLLLVMPAGCGGHDGDPDDAGDAADAPEDADAADATDPAADTPHDPAIDSLVDTPADVPVDPGEEDTRPPLGPCGGYCMGEERECPAGAICEFGILDITLACTDDGCGLCAWIPEDCQPDDDPVCGCDGVVYASACERRLAHAQPDPAWTNCTIPDD